jgi:Heterokaryon incompatibility protein Het-C
VHARNWLRDYSQAMDTGTLSKAQPETIRILVWILSFLSFGYATAEFEVTAERLGVYRPEEHIDKFVAYDARRG